MEKTIILTFALNPEVEDRQKHSLLEQAKENLESRTLTCLCDHHAGTVVAKYVHKDWNANDGRGHCPENIFWDIALAGFSLLDFTVEYTHALLPHPELGEDGNFRFRNGECYFFIEIYDKVVVTCLPSKKWVSICLQRQGCYNELDVLRRGFLNIERGIEAQLKLTQVALRFDATYKQDPQNDGRVQRYRNDLFLNIARV